MPADFSLLSAVAMTPSAADRAAGCAMGRASLGRNATLGETSRVQVYFSSYHAEPRAQLSFRPMRA